MPKIEILKLKVQHPTKGPLELGRWSKTDLAKVVIDQNTIMTQLFNNFARYRDLYGFHVE